ncbi:MAG TPA: hypothetical protein VK254_02180 [Candidatus Bathyarchaeia archaeon]|nr:hypothetical protein [Candidatus Bathyarchaeia archaeon]
MGQLNALVKNSMKQTGTTDPNEAIRRVNSGEWFLVERKAQAIPRRINLGKLTELAGPDGIALLEDVEKCLEPKWIEEDGVIYLAFPPTVGRTGEGWITYFEKKGDRVSDWAKSVLRSDEFKPTTGVAYKIAILKGSLWNDSSRITKNIRRDAYAGTFTKGKTLSDPNAEVACLIRDNFTEEEIEAVGLWWIVAMHEPIKDSDGGPSVLGAGRRGGGRWLRSAFDDPVSGWGRDGGFAFVVSQVSAEVSEA